MKLLSLILLLSAAGTAGAENLDTLIVSAGDKSTYPQASTIVIFDRTNIRLAADGRTRTRKEMLLKIVDERAKDEEGDQSIRFDAEQDTVIIEQARTRLPDGRWIAPEQDGFTLTSAPEVQFASAYSQLKQQNISFPGLDVGAAIHLVYRIEPKPGSEIPQQPRAGGITQFGGTNPILQKSYSVETEPGRTIRYAMQNSPVLPVVVFDGKTTAYAWEFRDTEQILTEPNMVSLAWLVPRLCWTTFRDWDELGLYMTERFWGAVDTSDLALDEYAKLSARSLSGKPAIFHTALWVQQNVRTVSLPLGRVGYEPNTADRVWQNKYGDVRDKNVLLATLLRGFGIASVPVLVLNRDLPFCELPVLEQFSHLILGVPQANDTIWLDPTVEHMPPGELPYSRTYSTACMLSDGAPLLMRVPRGTPVQRGTASRLNLTLAANGDLSGTVECSPQMDFAGSARATFKDQKERERDIYFQQLVSRFGQGSTVTDSRFSNPADLETPMVVSMSFESPGYGVTQDDLLMVELPGNPFNFGVTGFFPSLPEVRYPVALSRQARAVTEYTIDLPKKYSVAYLPPPLLIDNPYVYLELSPKQVGRTVSWSQVVECKQDQVPVAQYETLRDAYQQFVLPKNRMMMLEEMKGKK
ncbi:DUF3857 domain-containing protein [candidate division KSB1 bacterium]|nr:DUF3857 domain-containing protein [candidate division KSB1 bacterium]